MIRAAHTPLVVCAAAILAVTGQVLAVSSAQAGPAALAPAAVRGTVADAAAMAAASSPAATGGSDLSDLGANGWAVRSSAVATQTGAQIPVERQRADCQAGVGVAGRLQPGGLPGPADLLGRVQIKPAARGIRGEGRAV